MCQSWVLYNPRSHSKEEYATWKSSTKLITVRNLQTLNRWRCFMGWGQMVPSLQDTKSTFIYFPNVVGKIIYYSSSGFTQSHYPLLIIMSKHSLWTFSPPSCFVQTYLCPDFTPLDLKLLGFYSQLYLVLASTDLIMLFLKYLQFTLFVQITPRDSETIVRFKIGTCVQFKIKHNPW